MSVRHFSCCMPPSQVNYGALSLHTQIDQTDLHHSVALAGFIQAAVNMYSWILTNIRGGGAGLIPWVGGPRVLLLGFT